MSPAPLPSRRQILGGLAASAALAAACKSSLVAKSPPRFAKGRLRHACIGVGGMGAEDMKQLMTHPLLDVVALCDVDQGFLDEAAKKAPNARVYRDWRELLAAGGIDSVNVSVPDHMHAPIELVALRAGLHVYGQKPLTRTVAEARAVARAARKAGVVTQMGIQNHSNVPLRQAHALFERGLIGPVHEVHVWTDRPAGWWPQGVERPEGSDPVPAKLDWDKWLGVAPVRPYKNELYHPFAWRGRLDFGTGAQGDMACHLMDAVPWFLEIGLPLNVRSEGPPPTGDTYPLWSRVRYEFAPTRHTHRGPLVVEWHDGKRKAPRELLDDLGALTVPDNAALFVGAKGALIADPYAAPQLLPAAEFQSELLPALEPIQHWHQWVDACLGKGETSAHFDYAARLTEIALLGNIALRFPHETLVYDSAGMRFTNRPEANAFLRPNYRAGWKDAEVG